MTSDQTYAVQEAFQLYVGQLELEKADSNNNDCWDEACKGCTYMMQATYSAQTEVFPNHPVNGWLKRTKDIQVVFDVVKKGTLVGMNVAKMWARRRS